VVTEMGGKVDVAAEVGMVVVLVSVTHRSTFPLAAVSHGLSDALFAAPNSNSTVKTRTSLIGIVPTFQ